MDRDHSTSKHKQLDNERIHNESHEMYINYFKKRTNTQCIDYGYTYNLPLSTRLVELSTFTEKL